ncbi:hypothetical protein [Methylobacterium sp. CM6247]
MLLKSSILAIALVIPTVGLAAAQSLTVPQNPDTTGTVIQLQPNTTGNDRDVIISRGATGAETITTDSAAGGNANHPEQAVPNGSAGGGSSR